jgi:hypothetical protein
MFVKGVGAERDGVAHAAADEIADRLPHGAADEIEAGRLNGRVGARGGIERIFSGHEHGLRTRIAGALPFDEVHQHAGEREGIRTDEPRPECFQRGGGCFTAVSLRDAGQAAVALQFDNRAQRIRLMQPVTAANGRVGNGDFVDGEVGDAHGGVGCFAAGWI